MASMEGITLYTLPPSPPTWDWIGIFYVTFCVVWTTLVVSGIVFCWLNRRMPILNIRGIPLSFAAILFLHCYWILAQVVYPIGQTMNAILAYDIQYFFMGIWYPLGIATFHAANLRFLYVAKLQKQFTHQSLRAKSGCNGSKTSWLCWLRNLDYTQRIMILIGLGMILQVLLTIGMWLACKKYHPTYGIEGTGLKGATIPEQLVDLGRGWEWWPSLLWQFIWAWIVAPILIWRAWSINDTMGWRTQTIGCCISSLHAAPMFLIALYVPAFAKVNRYFAPSEWIHLSIMFFEIFTVFIPIYLVIKQKIQTKKAADANAKWETASQTSTLQSPTVEWKKSSISLTGKSGSIDILDGEHGDRLLTMSALDYILSENPGPLLEFSALRDFSGENIAFLTRTSRWKAQWLENFSEEHRLDAYNEALDIYTDFISPRDAEFPLNLSSAELKRLEGIFEKPARILCGEARLNPATPFDAEQSSFGSSPKSTWDLEASGAEIRARYTGAIPDGFNAGIYDGVLTHIKYLVLTNTWPKFVYEMQNRRRSSETGRSDFTENSQTTLGSLGSKVSHILRSIF